MAKKSTKKKKAAKKTKKAKRDYLKSVTNPFWLCSAPFESCGASYSLKELRDTLKVAPSSVISHHVTSNKNDFANWIEDVIGYKALAKKIRKIKGKDECELRKKIIAELNKVVK